MLTFVSSFHYCTIQQQVRQTVTAHSRVGQIRTAQAWASHPPPAPLHPPRPKLKSLFASFNRFWRALVTQEKHESLLQSTSHELFQSSRYIFECLRERFSDKIPVVRPGYAMLVLPIGLTEFPFLRLPFIIRRQGSTLNTIDSLFDLLLVAQQVRFCHRILNTR